MLGEDVACTWPRFGFAWFLLLQRLLALLPASDLLLPHLQEQCLLLLLIQSVQHIRVDVHFLQDLLQHGCVCVSNPLEPDVKSICWRVRSLRLDAGPAPEPCRSLTHHTHSLIIEQQAAAEQAVGVTNDKL